MSLEKISFETTNNEFIEGIISEEPHASADSIAESVVSEDLKEKKYSKGDDYSHFFMSLHARMSEDVVSIYSALIENSDKYQNANRLSKWWMRRKTVNYAARKRRRIIRRNLKEMVRDYFLGEVQERSAEIGTLGVLGTDYKVTLEILTACHTDKKVKTGKGSVIVMTILDPSGDNLKYNERIERNVPFYSSLEGTRYILALNFEKK